MSSTPTNITEDELVSLAKSFLSAPESKEDYDAAIEIIKGAKSV